MNDDQTNPNPGTGMPAAPVAPSAPTGQPDPMGAPVGTPMPTPGDSTPAPTPDPAAPAVPAGDLGGQPQGGSGDTSTGGGQPPMA